MRNANNYCNNGRNEGWIDYAPINSFHLRFNYFAENYYCFCHFMQMIVGGVAFSFERRLIWTPNFKFKNFYSASDRMRREQIEKARSSFFSRRHSHSKHITALNRQKKRWEKRYSILSIGSRSQALFVFLLSFFVCSSSVVFSVHFFECENLLFVNVKSSSGQLFSSFFLLASLMCLRSALLIMELRAWRKRAWLQTNV